MAVFCYVKLLKSVICRLMIWRVLLSHSVLIHKEKRSSLRRRSIQFKTHGPVKQNTLVS